MINKLRNMKISSRLMTSYIIILVLLVAGVIVSVVNLMRIGSQVEEFYEYPFQASEAANTLDSNFERMQGAIYRALSNEDINITNNAIAEAEEAIGTFTESLTTISERFTGDSSLETNLANCLTTLKPLREHVLALASENRNVEAAEYMEANNLPLMEEAQTYLKQLIADSSTMGIEMIDSLRSMQTRAVIILVALCAASVVVSILFAKFITNSISEPVDQLQEMAVSMSKGIMNADMVTYESQDELGSLSKNMKSTVAGVSTIITDISYLVKELSEGNFDIESEKEEVYRGDFAPVIEAINHMTKNLSQTLGEINEASSQVSAGSSQMAESAQSLAEGATEQAGAVEELNATVEDVANSAKSSAESSRKASGDVNHSVKRAEKSREEMQNLIQAMEQIDSTSKEIAHIIDAIEDIASQTNLLSLNASIEAARAGDAGRGFAVVANQIGKLASDSAQSAANTRTLITTILEKIETGNSITNSTAESFEDIIKDIESFAEVAENTSRMADEQYDTMQQVREGIEQISKVVQDNSAAAEETSATSEELAAQAVNLKSQVAKFKIKAC